MIKVNTKNNSTKTTKINNMKFMEMNISKTNISNKMKSMRTMKNKIMEINMNMMKIKNKETNNGKTEIKILWKPFIAISSSYADK